MNKKIRLIMIMGLTAIGITFGLLYLTWGGDNESKLEKTIITGWIDIEAGFML